MGALFAAHFALTCFLTGLIWTIQVLHYPMFDAFDRATFAAQHARHSRLVTLVVGPTMLAELLTGLALLAAPPPGVPRAVLAVLFALLLVAWASTAFVQVPLHGVLGRGFDARAHARLVASNGVRTAAWTLRALILLALLA